MTSLEAIAPVGANRHFTVGVTGMTCASVTVVTNALSLNRWRFRFSGDKA